MFSFNIFYSPLEQFEILPLIALSYGKFDLSITNQTVLLCLIVFAIVWYFFSLVKPGTNSLYVIPNRLQTLVEWMYLLSLAMVSENIKSKNALGFFPLIFTLFTFISVCNLIGLVPYSFTVTSHFIFTLGLSFIVFFGINVIGAQTHGLNFFSLFLPSGTPLPLAFLLIPVEFILYCFRPLSLAIRLFCNMMAGHILLKIFIGFSWSLMSLGGAFFLLHFIPIIILVPLFALEVSVAIIQAFVFSLLTCIYINDAINLH